MKKLIYTKANTLLLACGLLMAIVAGCKKVNNSDNLGPERIFKPGSVSVSAAQTSARVTWTASLLSDGKKLTYTAQFSQDTTFATTEFTLTTDSLGLTVTDDKLAVRKKYWVRVKANATGDQPESKWAESSGFQITGVQLFLAVRDLEVKETSATLRFTPTAGLDKIVLTPASGTATNVTLSATDASAGLKVITGLAAGTAYTAELFQGTKSKGLVTFTTQPLTVYTVKLNSGDNLATAIANAANNDVIGLNPGNYDLTASATAIAGKFITLKSTSSNPADTKVKFKEFDLKGTGAGLNFDGIEFDGAAPGNASYFINLVGATSDSQASAFISITVNNCIVHNTANCFIRGNRGAAGVHTIDFIKVTNTIGYDNGISTYDYFTLDKLAFNRLEISKSTFYSISRSIINCTTTLTGTAPTIIVNQCDFNNLGSDAGKYVILDASANPVNFTFTNNILANTPRSGGVKSDAVRAATISAFSNNNFFNFVTTVGGSTNVALPAQAANNKSVDLGWTATTTDFTLPAGSELRTSSTVGGAIGDPRWAY